MHISILIPILFGAIALGLLELVTQTSADTLQGLRTFEPDRSGVLDVLMIARAVSGPQFMQIESANASLAPQVWVYDMCYVNRQDAHARPDTWWTSCPNSSNDKHDSSLFRGNLLKLNRGDTLRIRLVNRLPNTTDGATPTSLHFHGVIVPTNPAINVNGNKPYGDFIFVVAFNSEQVSTAILNQQNSDHHHRRLRQDASAPSGSPWVFVMDYIDFEIRIPQDHPLGLFWFHPHVHHSTQGQIDAGLSGVIAIGEVKDFAANVAQVPQAHMLLRTTQVGPDGNRMVTPDPEFCEPLSDDNTFHKGGFCPGVGDQFEGGKEFFTINGQLYPEIDVGPNGQILRLTQSMSSVTLELQIQPKSSEELVTFQLLAVDGVSVMIDGNATLRQEHLEGMFGGKVRQVSLCGEGRLCATSLFMMPSSRADIWVPPMPEGTKALLLGVGPQMGWDGDLWPSVNLATINFTSAGTDHLKKPKVTGLSMPLPSTVATGDDRSAQRPSAKNTNCAPLPKGHRRRIYFGVPPRKTPDEEEGFGLAYEELDANGQVVPGTETPMMRFDASIVTVCTTVGSTEIWELINLAAEDHNFHLHQVKFRVITTADIQDGLDFPDSLRHHQVYVDNVPLLAADQEEEECTGVQDFKQGKCSVHPTTVEIPFTKRGDFLYHCHIAEHSDNGMMARIVAV